MKEFGRLCFTASRDNFAGSWRNADGESFQVLRDGAKMTAVWTAGKDKKELSGTVTNQTAKITFTIRPENVLSVGFKHLTGYACTFDGGQRFQWMLFDNNIPEFTEFTRDR